MTCTPDLTRRLLVESGLIYAYLGIDIVIVDRASTVTCMSLADKKISIFV
jgi:hypothetical protein